MSNLNLNNQGQDKSQSQPQNNFKQVSLQDITEYASNRTELYQKLSKVLDLPILGACISLDYLKELLNKNCKYFHITREKTRTLPIKNFRRCFDAKQTFNILEKLLKSSNQKPTGFSLWSLPDISWMLRVIIAIKPSEKDNILNYRKLTSSNQADTEKILKNQKIELNNELYQAIFSGQKSSKKNTAFRPQHINLTLAEDRKIKKLNDKMIITQKKINEYKMMMERVLIRQEEYQQEIEMIETEKTIKIKRHNNRNNRRQFKQESMEKISQGQQIQFSRVNQMFGNPTREQINRAMSSQKEKMKKEMLDLRQVNFQGNYANDPKLSGLQPSKPYTSPKISDENSTSSQDDEFQQRMSSNQMEIDTWSKSKQDLMFSEQKAIQEAISNSMIKEQPLEEIQSMKSSTKKVQSKLNFQKKGDMSIENTPGKDFKSFKTDNTQ